VQRFVFPATAHWGVAMLTESLETLTDVTNAVLLDALRQTLAELMRSRADAGLKLDEREFMSTAEDMVCSAMAAEDVARTDEDMIFNAVIDELHMAFVEASRIAIAH
jgi:hypothetical protein